MTRNNEHADISASRRKTFFLSLNKQTKTSFLSIRSGEKLETQRPELGAV
jgi:hypothetical protein